MGNIQANKLHIKEYKYTLQYVRHNISHQFFISKTLYTGLPTPIYPFPYSSLKTIEISLPSMYFSLLLRFKFDNCLNVKPRSH